MLSSSFLCLSLAALVAASSDSRCAGDITISTQSDADALSNCDTIYGPLTITSSARGAISLPNIEGIKGPLTIKDTQNLNAVTAKDLESVSGTVTVTGNKALTSLEFNDLGTVDGELKVQDNDNLKELKLDGLETVNRGLKLSGDFTSLSFSNLENVHGESNIQNSGNLSCSVLDRLRDQGAFQGSYSCSNSKSGSSGLSAGAKAGIAIGVILGVLLIVLLVWMCARRQRRQRRAQKEAIDNIAAAGAARTIVDEEKAEHRVSGTPSLPEDSSQMQAVNSIPRKPLSPPPLETEAGGGSTSLPSALVVGDQRASMGAGTNAQSDPSLFLRPMPRRQPSESDVPMLDSGDVHEAPVQSAREQDAPYELDAGPVRGTHQQAIHHD
ncbi:hypothetical protein EYZ11_004689 [Aspergillus tanneri]|uniref:Receptor L-domain domain-containing protein n=1 Tax=Aspergillus tanneri TaxID=1220188 RepID=A0A4S3JJS9_9EURO|nr:uncharacterized protein ATNIH1004_003545 [Aspergillus tanneri]KAA8650856.1 hypothetical protein ATNIH1004_003545 [Aspergillus tanneri]THC95819.1 hypothetical protein EYZ11_004689 [Aspergillus tanneri]